MTAASPRSFHTDYALPRPEIGTSPAQKSRSNVLPQSFGAEDGQRASDMVASPAHQRARALAARVTPVCAAPDFRDWFAPAFARWLQSNFISPEVVAAEFGVRYQTALNWWNAGHRASGDTVALAFLTFPDAVAWFLHEWEADR